MFDRSPGQTDYTFPARDRNTNERAKAQLTSRSHALGSRSLCRSARVRVLPYTILDQRQKIRPSRGENFWAKLGGRSQIVGLARRLQRIDQQEESEEDKGRRWKANTEGVLSYTA